MCTKVKLVFVIAAVLFSAVWGAALNSSAMGEELPRTLQNSGIFVPYVTYPVGSRAEAVAIGDVNDDGRNDAVIATSDGGDPENDHKIHVFLQNPLGGLDGPVKYSVHSAFYVYHPTSVDVGDLNNDGRNDVVVSADNSIGVFLQNPGGTLDSMVTYASSHSSHSNSYKVRVGDFNNDGREDVVSIDWGTQSHDVEVFLQNSSGTLDSPVIYVVEHGGYDDLEVGDVNNDGLDDIVVMSGQYYAYDNVGILIQSSAGSFEPPAYYDLGGDINTNGVAVGDINGDSLEDVVVTYNKYIGAFYQNVSGTLDPAVSYTSSGDTKPVEVGDVNLDGRNDVISAGGSTLEVHLQDSNGVLLHYELYAVPYQTHYKPHGLAIGDINGDGANDVALAHEGSGLVVLYNAFEAPPEPDIKANGLDTTVLITPSDTLDVTVSLDPGSMAGEPHDWWLGASTPYGYYWYTPSRTWVRSEIPIGIGSYGLFEVPETTVLHRTLPSGFYLFFFVLDKNPNGVLDDMTFLDYVTVIVSF